MRKMCAKIGHACGSPEEEKKNIRTCCVSGLAYRIETTLSDGLLAPLPKSCGPNKGLLLLFTCEAAKKAAGADRCVESGRLIDTERGGVV